MSEEPRRTTDEDEPPPLLGSWPALYGAVVILAVASIAAVALFSTWRF